MYKIRVDVGALVAIGGVRDDGTAATVCRARFAEGLSENVNSMENKLLVARFLLLNTV